MVGGTPVGREVEEAGQEPAGLAFGDDVPEVSLAVDAEDAAIVDEGVGDGQARPSYVGMVQRSVIRRKYPAFVEGS
jgi:hypothetical protein